MKNKKANIDRFKKWLCDRKSKRLNKYPIQDGFVIQSGIAEFLINHSTPIAPVYEYDGYRPGPRKEVYVDTRLHHPEVNIEEIPESYKKQ